MYRTSTAEDPGPHTSQLTRLAASHARVTGARQTHHILYNMHVLAMHRVPPVCFGSNAMMLQNQGGHAGWH